MIKQHDIDKYSAIISEERLKAFIKSNDDTIDDVINRYADNIKISQALYPELSILEVTLRNAIDKMLKTYVSKTWLEDEINNNQFLDAYDFQTLQKTYYDTKSECINNSKQFTIGKVIANLNFGFWNNICTKKYSIFIWHKKNCFRSVFVNYPNKKQEISKISRKLYEVRHLRNRIFHYEQIFKYPQKTLQLYNLILEVISYLPDNGNSDILNRTSSFVNTYNQITKQYQTK